ncbi:MAG: lamin tail domain-containing protein [Candidatus Thalassarchaeaceae archaeon]|nr:lamin tail domain-containing protein [Candidatus Thalassarchaeaceae archaeon]
MQTSKPILAHSSRDEENAMTAVIEFLTAFVLFLMIVTAFLSLAQLTLGPYDSTTDRLDAAAVSGLSRLTDSPGWFTPVEDGERDVSNSTVEWHRIPAQQLADGDVLPGLLSLNGSMDIERLQALANVTESQLAEGIGLDDNINLRLMVKVIESTNPLRVNMILFDDGTSRDRAKDSATASRTFAMNDESVRVTLEVHDGVKGFTAIEISEFLPRTANGGPEWIELHNPNGFAVEMSGWGLERTTPGFGSAFVLFEEGTFPGKSHAILTGDEVAQETGNATWVIDLSTEGLLGFGSIEGLGDSIGRLQLTRASKYTTGESMVMEIEWDLTWNLSSGHSLTWTGDEPMEVNSWTITAIPTPGD